MSIPVVCIRKIKSVIQSQVISFVNNINLDFSSSTPKKWRAMKTTAALTFVTLCVLSSAWALPSSGGNVDSRIAGGLNATDDQFPWLVSIIMDRAHFCSGSLIAHDWVLTSAHCTYKYSAFIVSLGSLYPDSHHVAETISHEKYVHPEFDADAADDPNDVGLIKLVRNINFTVTISSVAMEGWTGSLSGYRGRIAGWGNITSDSKMLDNLAPTLQWTEMTILDEQKCSDDLGVQVDATHLCTSGTNMLGVCGGDDGGGLVVQIGGRWKLAGIAASSNSTGCDSGKPSVYTRISKHADWITSVTGIAITASSAANSMAGSLLMMGGVVTVWWMARKEMGV